MPSRSAIWVRGLAIVSAKTIRVSGRKAAATFSATVASTSDTLQPRVSRVCSRLLVLPNRNWLATMWSPRFSSANSSEAMAPMPVAKHTVPTPPSSSVILLSSAWLVGLPCRA